MEFPSDGGPASVGGEAGVVPDVLLRKDVKARCARLGVGADALLLAAYALTLYRWTGVAGVAVRCGTAVPTVTLVEDQNTDDLLRVVHGLLASAAAARSVARSVATSEATEADVQAAFGPGAGAADGCDVWVRADWGRSDWQVDVGCRPGVWAPTELAAFAADLLAAVKGLATVSGPVEDIRCVSAERLALIHRVNQGSKTLPSASIEELFWQVVRRRPDAHAVREGGTVLTYAELSHAAAVQAQALYKAGVRAGDTVLIGVPRSIAEVVAVLGTLMAGAAYVGVESAVPDAYLGEIVRKCAPAAVLCADELAVRMPTGIPVVEVWSAQWSQESKHPEPEVDYPQTDPADRLAYVAFTSGSTGAPKGVCVPHLGVIRLALGADYLGLEPGDRMLRLSPLAFDASTLELWGALLNGATLEVYTDPLPSPSELGEFLVERGVTVAWLTAGLFRMVAQFAPDSVRGLRHLVTGGDVVSPEHVAKVLARHPDLVVTNGYGPTENTTFTTTHTVTAADDLDRPLPIGTPVAGTAVFVLDRRGRLLPPGAVGELYTSGAGLATGYLGDEAETRRRFGRFCPDVPDRLYRTGDLVRLDGAGRLAFLGRADDQVKLRGYRIELSAVAGVIAGLPGVKDAVVTAVGADSASKRLVASVVPADGAEPGIKELRSALERRLPSYMVPTLWAIMDRLPLTRNGKVDHQALAEAARPAG
ncbi:amino acid adenylation domain-containing protein [Catenulispora yoronensis]